MPTKIPIHVSNHKAYIWDVKDVEILRSEHRICGLLAGTLPHLSQQNIFLGVPLVLIPEEVVLLVENNIAILVDNSAAHHTPTAEQLREWSQLREKERNEELLRLAVHKEEATSKKSSEEAVRKRLEREAKRADSTNEETKQSTVALACSGQDLSAHMIVIPTLSPNLPWFTLENHVFHTLESAIQAGIWDFPSSLQERASCGVFRALWEKGYYLGNGVKFGGEYLVYPGDPLRYHSHFVATVQSGRAVPLRPMEIVAHGRLGTATKKAHVMCCWDDESKSVDMYSIEWAGFG